MSAQETVKQTGIWAGLVVTLVSAWALAEPPYPPNPEDLPPPPAGETLPAPASATGGLRPESAPAAATGTAALQAVPAPDPAALPENVGQRKGKAGWEVRMADGKWKRVRELLSHGDETVERLRYEPGLDAYVVGLSAPEWHPTLIVWRVSGKSRVIDADPKISPDGRWLAEAGGGADTMGLDPADVHLWRVGTQAIEPDWMLSPSRGFENENLESFRWVDASTFVLSVSEDGASPNAKVDQWTFRLVGEQWVADDPSLLTRTDASDRLTWSSRFKSGCPVPGQNAVDARCRGVRRHPVRRP